jgi:hypothetical protein
MQLVHGSRIVLLTQNHDIGLGQIVGHLTRRQHPIAIGCDEVGSGGAAG